MLVSMKSILDKANEGGYAVLAPNIFTEMDARTYIEAAEDMNSPIVLGIAFSTTNDLTMLGRIAGMLAENSRVPVAVNLDHGADMKQIVNAIRGGLTSVMLDCSMLPYEENVRRVREVVDLVHPLGISVEAEIGHVGSGESYSCGDGMTTPEDAKRFIEETGIDACAVAIGTAHGAYSGTPKLDFNRLESIKALTGFPLVLHGSSGTGEELIGKACNMGINKVNVAYDLLYTAYTSVKTKELIGNQIYDFWTVIADALRTFVKHQIEITGSTGKAWTFDAPGLPRGIVTMRE